MNDAPQTLDDMWRLGDAALVQGVKDRTHPARHPVFATLGPDGPEQRVLVLRGWDNGSVRLQTDAATAKVAQLAADPRCALHVWVPDQALQLRLSGTAIVSQGPSDDWDRMPQTARGVYGGAPNPGTPIADPDDYTPGAELTRYRVLSMTCHKIEVLHLGDTRHVRAVFHRDTNWTGRWIAP